MTEAIDLRTETERARDERHEAICRDYAALHRAYPQYRPYRIMAVLGERHGMSVPGIKKIVESHGLYSPKAPRTA